MTSIDQHYLSKIKQLSEDKDRLCEQIVDLNAEVTEARQERDELRVQVANLYDALQQIRRIALNVIKKDLTPQEKLASIEIAALHALNKTPHNVAQYVRGLERERNLYKQVFDALERYEQTEKLHWKTRDALKTVRDIQQALAAKQDRG